MVIRKFKFTFTTQKFINLMKFLKDRTTIKKSLSIFFKIFVSIRSTPYCKSQNNVVPLHGGIIFLILRQEYAI